MNEISENSVQEVCRKAIEEISACPGPEELESVRIKYLGRKGVITALMKQLPGLTTEEKRAIGGLLNSTKVKIDTLLGARGKELSGKQRIQEPVKIDTSLPGMRFGLFNGNPLVQTTEEILEIFSTMGFSIVTGPEIETDYYNFEALNIPEHHPARDMQDTFYIAGSKKRVLLRTHTSPVQVRYMEKNQPPVRVVIPGRVYRHEATDATHSAIFNQVEGLVVDENVTFADLKGTLTVFAKTLFGKGVDVRFRPSYFPFTEPSAEMDIKCGMCLGRGCRACGNNGWIETLGCGMVHPKVLEGVGYDVEKYTGFAFGLGVERFAMQKYHIEDMRLFYQNDIRFLRQF
ncbi:MAG: phenylalanine--tRNA ligase subunit alpha [Elusimicrobiota bacterium]